MRCLLVLLLCASGSVAHAKGPSTSTRSPAHSSSTREVDNAIGYRIFGAHMGATFGSLAVGAAFATGNEAAPATPTLVALPMTMTTMVTMASFARHRRWNARVGSALAGMHPGFGYGALTGFMIAAQSGLEGRARRGTIFGFGAALSVVTMGIWSRIVGRSLRRALGLLYILPLVASLVILPYALLADKPRSLGWASVGMGAVALTIAAFNTEF